MEPGSLNSSLWVVLLISLAIGLANLGCLVYMLIKMYSEKGLFHVLIGFFCCQLYPFIWGWLNAARFKIYDIMIFWTIITILSLVLQVVLQSMGIAAQNFNDF
jgi:hypothetical protein